MDFLRTLDPSSFVQRFLDENARPDGRSFSQARHCVFSPSPIVMSAKTGAAGTPGSSSSRSVYDRFAGSALVRLGGTAALATTTAHLERGASRHARVGAGGGAPSLRGPCHATALIDAPSEASSLAVTLMLPAVASSSFRQGPGSSMGSTTSITKQGFDPTAPIPSADRLSEATAEVIQRSGIPRLVRKLLVEGNLRLGGARKARTLSEEHALGEDLEALAFDSDDDDDDDDGRLDAEGVALPGFTSTLSVSVTFTAFDGNAFDAAILASTCALLRLSISDDGILGSLLAEDPEVSIPLPASFAVLPAKSGENRTAVLVDPTSLEEMGACCRFSAVLGLRPSSFALGLDTFTSSPLFVEKQTGPKATGVFDSSRPLSDDALLMAAKERVKELKADVADLLRNI